MKIEKLKLNHFRRFNDFEITFDPQVTVLVAKNGAGKSSILDAVAIGVGAFLTRLPKVVGLNFKETDFQVSAMGQRPAYMRLSCTSFDGVCWDRTEKRDKTEKTAAAIPEGVGVKQLNDFVDTFIDAQNESRDYVLPIFVHYGTGRGVFDVPLRTKGFNKDFTRFNALTGALESRSNFKRFVEYFYYLESSEDKLQKETRSFENKLPQLEAIRAAVHLLMPAFSNPRSVYPAGIMLDWTDNDEVKQLRIEQLSDGYRTTLAMAMDIAARMAEANPDSEQPLNTPGVVMIDEVDLHLHPGWQQTIISDLTRTFSNIQFIVSTHSSQIVSTVRAQHMRVIDWQNEQPKLLPVDFCEGDSGQQVLLNILGVESPRAERLDFVQRLRQYQKTPKPKGQSSQQ